MDENQAEKQIMTTNKTTWLQFHFDKPDFYKNREQNKFYMAYYFLACSHVYCCFQILLLHTASYLQHSGCSAVVKFIYQLDFVLLIKKY